MDWPGLRDGRTLVFAAILDGPSVDLYLLDRQDHSIRADGFAGDEFAPAWSPDGSTLVYYSSDVDAQGVEVTEVWTVEPISGR
jgi:Tol biopolymer transport system component